MPSCKERFWKKNAFRFGLYLYADGRVQERKLLLYSQTVWLVQLASKLRISDTFVAPSKWTVDAIRGQKQDVMVHQFINLYTQAPNSILIPHIGPTLTALVAKGRRVNPLSWFNFTNGNRIPLFWILVCPLIQERKSILKTAIYRLVAF
jgi:hypothetical protein